MVSAFTLNEAEKKNLKKSINNNNNNNNFLDTIA